MDNCVLTPNGTNILHPLDKGIIQTFKHYCCNQLVRTIISATDHKLLHDATLVKVNVLDVLLFIAESWRSVTHMTIVNCFQKCGFYLCSTTI
jgi:hypothetical protein